MWTVAPWALVKFFTFVQACNRALFSGKLQYVDLDSILFLEVVLFITNFPYFTGLGPVH